jgi:hypothetical protein
MDLLDLNMHVLAYHDKLPIEVQEAFELKSRVKSLDFLQNCDDWVIEYAKVDIDFGAYSQRRIHGAQVNRSQSIVELEKVHFQILILAKEVISMAVEMLENLVGCEIFLSLVDVVTGNSLNFSILDFEHLDAILAVYDSDVILSWEEHI